MTNKLIALCLFVLGVSISCVDDQFDTPPVDGSDPDITVTHTIAEIKTLFLNNELNGPIAEDWVISGVVVSSDEAGNFFRQLYIQDETSGIELRLEETNLYNTYPIGRRVFVKLQGLTITEFAGLLQVAQGEERIPLTLIPEVIFPGTFNNEVVPRVYTIEEIKSLPLEEYKVNVLSTYITIENLEFAIGDAGVTYADAVNNSSVNLDLQDCDGEEFVLRTSGFSSFAGETTPSGNGSISGIVGIFEGGSTDYQLQLNSLDDVDFSGERCDGSTGGGEELTIRQLRDAFASGATEAPAGFIQGIVISDEANMNINVQNLYIQDGTAGIIVRFTAEHQFGLGEELKVTVSGRELSQFRGSLQVSGVPNGAAVSQGVSATPTPRVANVQNVIDNGNEWEGTLVRLNGVSLDGSTFDGTVTVSDATGSLPMFAFSSATFANNPVPDGEVDLIGIVTIFEEDIQVSMRNADDVIGGTTGTGDKDTLTLRSVRDDYLGGATSAKDGYVIATVISDVVNGNTTDRNAVVQDETAGIVVRFNDAHSFDVGTVLKIDVNGMELSDFNGLIQINNVPNANASVMGSAAVTPIELTISSLVDNFEDYESRLVRVNDVTLSGSSTFGGVITISDATGSLPHFTRGAASFADAALPSGSVDVIAMGTFFNEPQLGLRSLDDVIE